jgi:hypothetical protein
MLHGMLRKKVDKVYIEKYQIECQQGGRGYALQIINALRRAEILRTCYEWLMKLSIHKQEKIIAARANVVFWS